MLIGQLLRKERQAKGLALGELASASGINRSTLWRWESDKTVPYTHELARVMDALGLTPQQRQTLYGQIEAPRAVQAAQADAGAASVPISTGELLRALRVRAKVTQSQAAQAAGVSRIQVAHWENGAGIPTDVQLHALCFAYRVTDGEMEFLTTRGWRDFPPLPMDKILLFDVLSILEFNDHTPNCSGAYLAIVARYQALYKAGKISEDDASWAWGNYGWWLMRRLQLVDLGRQIGAPAIAALMRSREPVGNEQYGTLALVVESSTRLNNTLAPAIAALDVTANRMARNMQTSWFAHAALVYETLGNVDQARRYYTKSIHLTNTDLNASIRRAGLRSFLIRQRRYREALPLLEPLHPLEARPIVKTTSLMEHAIVLGHLGQMADATRYYAEARALIETWKFDYVLSDYADHTRLFN